MKGYLERKAGGEQRDYLAQKGPKETVLVCMLKKTNKKKTVRNKVGHCMQVQVPLVIINLLL